MGVDFGLKVETPRNYRGAINKEEREQWFLFTFTFTINVGSFLRIWDVHLCLMSNNFPSQWLMEKSVAEEASFGKNLFHVNIENIVELLRFTKTFQTAGIKIPQSVAIYFLLMPLHWTDSPSLLFLESFFPPHVFLTFDKKILFRAFTPYNLSGSSCWLHLEQN